MSSYAAMRLRCLQLLDQLGVRPPMTLFELVVAVSTWSGEPITLAPAVLDSGHRGLFGLTTPDPAGGEIVSYQARTSLAHQVLIVLHELAHIIAGHPRESASIRPADVRPGLDRLSESILHLALGSGDTPSPAGQAITEGRAGLLEELRAAAGGEPHVSPTATPVEVPWAAVEQTLYGRAAEWEAESMARIMWDWLVTPRRDTRTTSSGLSAVLGDPGRWP